MEISSTKRRGRRRGISLPTQGRGTIDSLILLRPQIIPTYNPIHSSCGVTWDDDLIKQLIIIFEET
jgi:hypothetical protein